MFLWRFPWKPHTVAAAAALNTLQNTGTHFFPPGPPFSRRELMRGAGTDLKEQVTVCAYAAAQAAKLRFSRRSVSVWSNLPLPGCSQSATGD